MPPRLRDPSDPREWLRRARSSLALASAVPADSTVLFEDLCFLAQQAAEKALKAVLVCRGRKFPKTHDIALLLELVRQAGAGIEAGLDQARRLTPYAVGGRYPDTVEDVDEEEWREIVALAERVVGWAAGVIDRKDPAVG